MEHGDLRRRLFAHGADTGPDDLQRLAAATAILQGNVALARHTGGLRESGGMKRRSFRRPSRPMPPSAFAGFRLSPDVILLDVRWYLRLGLSYRDVEELLAERGIDVDHVTVYRWVQRFTPLLAEATRPTRCAVGDRWHVDETYLRWAGRGDTCTGP